MSLTEIKVYLLLACLGHALCCICDRAITYTPNGRFAFGDLHDNAKLSALFDGAPLRNQLFSMLAGVLAMTLSSLGYIALYRYVEGYSTVCGTILLVSLVMLMVPGTAHHVFCGAVEWFYIRIGRTEESRQAITEFFKKNIFYNACMLRRLCRLSCDIVCGCRVGHDGIAEMGLRIQRFTAVYPDVSFPHCRLDEHSKFGNVSWIVCDALCNLTTETGLHYSDLTHIYACMQQ